MLLWLALWVQKHSSLPGGELPGNLFGHRYGTPCCIHGQVLGRSSREKSPDIAPSFSPESRDEDWIVSPNNLRVPDQKSLRWSGAVRLPADWWTIDHLVTKADYNNPFLAGLWISWLSSWLVWTFVLMSSEPIQLTWRKRRWFFGCELWRRDHCWVQLPDLVDVIWFRWVGSPDQDIVAQVLPSSLAKTSNIQICQN